MTTRQGSANMNQSSQTLGRGKSLGDCQEPFLMEVRTLSVTGSIPDVKVRSLTGSTTVLMKREARIE